jgi:putative FmdB family regulatory protein
MPVYEFKCNECGELFELLLSMDSSPGRVCPRCGGEALRIISRTASIVRASEPSLRDSGPGGCGRSDLCCGRDEPCDHKPCEDR